MTGKELLIGMSFVEERFVAEADSQSVAKVKNRAWIKWASLAACVCVLLLGLRGLERSEEPMAAEPAAGAPAATIADAKDVCGTPMAPTEEPGAPAAGAAPTVVRIDEWTGTDFTGTVISGDAFDAGAKVTVVLEPSEEMRGWEAYPAGSIVEVRTVSFDEESGTIFASAIALAEE